MAASKRVRIGVGNQVARMEVDERPPHAHVDDELRDDEKWQGQEKPRLYIHVEQKGNERVVSSPCASLPHREQQQREPRDHDGGEDTAMDQRQGIVGEARPAKKLKQRAAQHQGKVGWLWE